MKITDNIDDIIARFQEIADKANTFDYSAPLIEGVNAAKAVMTFRIFNKGLDRDEVSFGKYVGRKSFVSNRRFAQRLSGENIPDIATIRKTNARKAKFERNTQKRILETGENQFTEYEKKRLEHGRQINYKDLEFTGSLRRSIITATESERRVVCAINNQQEFEIAEGQEFQIGRIRSGGRAKIFALSENERQVLKDETNNALQQFYVSLFRT